jgi:hypothetical protein
MGVLEKWSIGSMELGLHYSNIPIIHQSFNPQFQHSIIPLFHHSIMSTSLYPAINPPGIKNRRSFNTTPRTLAPASFNCPLASSMISQRIWLALTTNSTPSASLLNASVSGWPMTGKAGNKKNRGKKYRQTKSCLYQIH